MTVKCLDYSKKKTICKLFLEGEYTQTDLAEMYFVSPRTIKRVLVECGVFMTRAELKRRNEALSQQQDIDLGPTRSAVEQKMLDVIRKNNLSPESLQELLAQKPLTAKNVITVLQNMPVEKLQELVVGIIRRSAQASAANDPMEPASHAR